MSTRLPAASSLPNLARSGRWLTTSSGGLFASWSSASVSFLFTGSKLILSVGGSTERKDPDNGGTHMIAILKGDTEDAALRDLESWQTFDPKPNSEIVIFDDASGNTRQERTYVRIVLIDWASTFELEALVVDESASIEPFNSTEEKGLPSLLVIGDSISSGLAVPVESGGEPVPFGVLNTFPFVAQRVLRQDRDLKIGLELVAYPGYNLVHPTEEENLEGKIRNGMVNAFSWDSPWNKTSYFLDNKPSSYPIAVLIELGTNDQFFGISSERFGNGLVTLVAGLNKLYGNSIRHVWVVPPFPDSDTENRELNNAMPDFITVLRTAFREETTFQICDLVEGLTTANTVDGVHPPLAVHVELGKKLADFITKNLV